MPQYDSEVLAPYNTESAVIKIKMDTLWSCIKTLDFGKLFPSSVAACYLLAPLDAPHSSCEKEDSPIVCSKGGSPKNVKVGKEKCPHACPIEEAKSVTTTQGARYICHCLPCSEEVAAARAFMCPSAVGSLRHVEYKDGAKFTYRVLCIDESEHKVAYELIDTDVSTTVSGVQHSIQLITITEDDSTLVQWTTHFTSDVDYYVFQDSKYKKMDAFKDLRKCCAVPAH